MDNNRRDEEQLREEATRILRQHPSVPSDFEVIDVFKADAQAVENARGTLHLDTGDKVCLALLSPLLLPMLLLGMGCAIRNSHKLLTGLVDGAEGDIYVFGKAGFATINNGAVKAWTSSAGMALHPNMSMFYQSTSGPCGTTMKRQTVLVVQKNPVMGETVSTRCCDTHEMASFRSGKYQQVWFVGANDIQTIPAKVNMALAGGGLQGTMAGLMGLMSGMRGLPGNNTATMVQEGSTDQSQLATADAAKMRLGSTMSAEQQAQMAAIMQQQGMTFQTSMTQY